MRRGYAAADAAFSAFAVNVVGLALLCGLAWVVPVPGADVPGPFHEAVVYGAFLGLGIGIVHAFAQVVAVVYAERASWRRACVRTATGVSLVLLFPLVMALPFLAFVLYPALTPWAARRWVVPDDRPAEPG